MTSAGDTLRRERLQRKLDLDQISAELKISRRMLESIESDQYDRLPGRVFAKAFVRQYAALLGLDGEELAGQVQRAMEPSSAPFDEPRRPNVAPIDVPPVEEWTSVGDRKLRFSGSLPSAALVIVVMLVCSAVYAWFQRPRIVTVTPPSSPQTARTEAATAAPPPAEQTPAPVPAAEPPASTEQPAPTAASSAPPAESASAQPVSPPQTQAASAPGPVHVEIVADEQVWVLARADGKYIFSGVLEPNAKRAVDGEKDVFLRLGNAGGASISLNGNPVGSVGPKGQPRSLQFTSGGFQIVSAKPAPPATLDPLDR